MKQNLVEKLAEGIVERTDHYMNHHDRLVNEDGWDLDRFVEKSTFDRNPKHVQVHVAYKAQFEGSDGIFDAGMNVFVDKGYFSRNWKVTIDDEVVGMSKHEKHARFIADSYATEIASYVADRHNLPLRERTVSEW